MLKIEPSGRFRDLTIPNYPSEEQIRFELCKRIESFALIPILERRILGGRLDVVIFDKTRTAIAIVETKADSDGQVITGKHRNLYAAHGVPLYLVCGMSDVLTFATNHLPCLVSDYYNDYAKRPATLTPHASLMISDKRSLHRKRLSKRKLAIDLREQYPNVNFKAVSRW